MTNNWKSQWSVEYWRALREKAPNKEYEMQYKAYELGTSFKGLTKPQQRDFDYFLADAKKEKCFPNHFCTKPKLNYKPLTTEEWYWLWDTHGFSGKYELHQPNISECEGIKQSKEFLNLTIKVWVESCIELPVAFNFEEIKAYCNSTLPYTWDTFCNQLKKECIKKDGFIISFIRNKIEIK